MSQFIVKVSAANMPSSCWGQYVRVAVLEVEDGAKPKMISTHARGVKRIVRTWERCHSGKGVRDAHTRALREAEALAVQLNAEKAAAQYDGCTL